MDQAQSPVVNATPTSSLRHDLFSVLMLALVIPGALAILILLTLNWQKTIEVDVRAKAEQFADLLQAGLVLPLWNVALDTARPLMQAVVADPSVAWVEVRDTTGEMVLEFHRPEDVRTTTIKVSRQIVKEGAPLGEVRLAYATDSAQSDALHSSWLLAAVVGCQFVVSLLLMRMWLNLRVHKPLNLLRSSAASISTGDLKTAVPALRHDEFGVLGQQLDSMRIALAQSVDVLEERVTARTTELRQANTHLEQALHNLRQAQDRLIQSEKLVALGSLVAGVAHELNTPIGNGLLVISTVLGQTHEFRASMGQGLTKTQLSGYLDQVEQGAEIAASSLNRAANLIQDFKQFAVDQTSLRRRRFDLKQVVRETLAAVSVVRKYALAKLHVDVPEGIEMESYPGAIGQIVSNLFENAVVHAFSEQHAGTVRISALLDGELVVLTVSDDGAGIAPENLSRIFDPFYTTRMGSGGSGLGLSIVFSLLSGLLGGTIDVESSLGQGTVFRLKIPRVAAQRDEAET